ncbi:MAG: hypothetical protein KC468_29275, partial [Myxococcales bacterium]|nr:hypothetical protein [Myxococcales bacterium]
MAVTVVVDAEAPVSPPVGEEASEDPDPVVVEPDEGPALVGELVVEGSVVEVAALVSPPPSSTGPQARTNKSARPAVRELPIHEYDP